MGEPKQLLRYNGKSLVQHAVRTAVSSSAHKIVVVVGSNASAIKKEIINDRAEIIENDGWQNGMAGSIVRGVQQIM